MLLTRRNQVLTNIAAIGGGTAAFSPGTSLGAKLLAWWIADDATTITDAGGGLVSSWKDKVAAIDAAQATGAAQPVWSATSFNGAPGVTFDGTDDCLVLAPPPASFPVIAVSSDIWVLVQNNALAADATVRQAFAYGGNTAASGRGAGRNVSGGVNRGRANSGNLEALDSAVDLSTRHVIRAQITATDVTVTVDGGTPVVTLAVPSTTAGRLRIGAGHNSAAATFWNGIIREVLLTDATTTAGEVTSLQTYLMARR